MASSRHCSFYHCANTIPFHHWKINKVGFEPTASNLPDFDVMDHPLEHDETPCMMHQAVLDGEDKCPICDQNHKDIKCFHLCWFCVLLNHAKTKPATLVKILKSDQPSPFCQPSVRRPPPTNNRHSAAQQQ